jgi:predicted Zn-dependent peptidase
MKETRSVSALLVETLPDRRTVTAGVWIAHGSAHDPAPLAGATHLVEHLTLRRCGDHDRHSLAALVDRLGGDVDAWTGCESMGVSIQTTRDALPEALELLQDAILRPTFATDDVELERKVSLAELELVNDDPSEQVEEALVRAAWGGHPIAQPVIGTAESLVALDAATLRRHHAQLIRPGRVLLAVAGSVEMAEVASLASRLPLSAPVAAPPLPPLRWLGGREEIARVGVDQAHVRLAFPAMPASSPEVSALSVFNRVLGVGASSRLFQRLREDEGLTYDIWSSAVLRRQGGLLEVGWTCSPQLLNDVWRLVREELAALQARVRDGEVEVAREGLLRGLDMDAETTGGLCSMAASEVLERDRTLDLDRIVAEIRAVRTDEVATLARTMLRAEHMASAVCGPAGSVQLVA